MKLFTPLAALLVVASTNAIAQQEREGDRKTAEMFYAKADSLMNSGKTAAWLSMLAPSFYYVNTQGKRTDCEDFKKMIWSMKNQYKDMQMKTTVKNVQVQTDELMVWSEERVNFKVRRNGRWVPMTQTSRYADSLVKTSDGWKIMSSQQLVNDEPWTFKTGGK